MHNLNQVIQKLFQQKKYLEIINLIENKTEEAERSTNLFNILGLCTLLFSSKKENLPKVINYFKKGYLKEKSTPESQQALINLINISVVQFVAESKSEKKNFNSNLFNEIDQYYEDSKIYFSDKNLLRNAMVRKLRKSSNVFKLIRILKEITDDNPKDIVASYLYIYFNYYIDNWDQKTFLKNLISVEKKLPIFSINNLIPLKTKKKKIKNLAFISSDIRQGHSGIYFLRSILENYNKEKFKLFLYYDGKEDDGTAEIKKFFDVTKKIESLEETATINLIRSDEIDIMIDLMGISSNQKLTLFKNRLAPIQISWCGQPNTTGIKNMDYLISDKNLIFENEKKLYRESIIFMPNTWLCHCGFNNDRIFIKSNVNRKKTVNFGSFNNFYKITPKVVNVWSRILKNVKNSKLFLKSSFSVDNSSLIKQFKENKVLDSVIFLPRTQNFKDHLNLYKKIDIALDTFPFNGITTSFEATWMNIPIITMRGFNFNSRCGESFNKNLGMHDLIANNDNQYVDITIKLAKNINYLNTLREKIFNLTDNSPLFNKKQFSQDFFEIIYNLK